MEVERRRAGVPLAKTNQPWKPKTRNSRRRHWTKVVRRAAPLIAPPEEGSTSWRKVLDIGEGAAAIRLVRRQREYFLERKSFLSKEILS
jgi:hypothetical protein